MANSFKDPEQLQMLCDSQFKTIVELSQKIQSLELEVISLKQKNTVPTIVSDNVKDIIKLEVSDPETIAKLQLMNLRDVALQRDLTLEEARKLEIYTKILNSAKAPKEIEPPFKKLSDEDLIKELSDGTEG